MLKREAPVWSTLAVLLVFIPRVSSAQPVASSFDDLRRVLEQDQTVVVTDVSGQRIKGTVAEVSSSSLVILTPGRRTFTEGAVTQIRTVDRLLNGALIGAAIGTGLATWDYFIDPSEPGNATVFAAAISLGTAVGTVIDALVRKEKILYAPARQTRRLLIAPALGTRRQGVLVSVRF